MKYIPRLLRYLTFACFALASSANALAAQTPDYPKQPITIVMPFPAGSVTDTLARRLAADLQKSLGQPVLVDNRAGASGQIGSNYVAHAQPDGYTLLLTPIQHAINPALRSNIPYDAQRDFTPIAFLASAPIVLLVHPSLPVNSVQEYLAYAKKKNGLSFGTSGIGGGNHLSGKLLALQTGAPLVHVPYKGSAPALNDLLGGQIPSAFNDLPTALPYILDGRLKALGVTSRNRAKALPDVPTIAEQGVPGYESSTWFALYGPANLPAPLVALLHDQAMRSMHGEEMAGWLRQGGGEPGTMSSDEFRDFLGKELAKWRKVVTEAHIEAE